VLKDGHLLNETHSEGRKGVCTAFGGRHHKELELRVLVQLPEDVGRGNEGLTYASESLDADLVRTVLKELSNVILDWRWCGEANMIPNDKQELAEVLFEWIS
jgi:hypothetical protein